MSEKLKNYLGIAGIAALSAVAIGVLSFANSYSDASEPNNYRSFSVTGEAKRVVVPDIAQFTFTVLTEGGKDLAKLQKENTNKANAAIAFIKENDVDAKDIRTSGYSVSPRYQYYSCDSRPVPFSAGTTQYGEGTTGMAYPIQTTCKPPEIVGYTIRQTVEVKVRDFEVLGDIVGGVVSKGANEVSGVQFTVDDPEKVREEARAEAIEEARAKAKAIARAGRFDLGKLISLNEGGSYPMPYYRTLASDAGGFGGAEKVDVPSVAFEPGSEEIVVSVTLQYEIED